MTNLEKELFQLKRNIVPKVNQFVNLRSNQIRESENSIEISKIFSDFHHFTKNYYCHYFEPNLIDDNVHKTWCDTLQQVESGDIKKLLVLEPRGTLKSTIICESFAIWYALKNPNHSIGIVRKIDKQAISRLDSIRRCISANKKFIDIFGNLEGEPSSSTRMNMKNREILTGDYSFNCYGLGSQIVGSHLDLFILDDIVTVTDAMSQAEKEKTARWFSGITSILKPESKVVILGTRWDEQDLYNDIINVRNPSLEKKGLQKYYIIEGTPIKKGVTFNIDDLPKEDNIYRFPQLLNFEKLSENRSEINEADFYANYFQDPRPPSNSAFKKLHFFDDIPENTKLFFAGLDLATGAQGGDLTSLVVLGIPEKEDSIYVVDSYAENITLSELPKVLAHYFQKYNLYTLLVEGNIERHFRENLQSYLYQYLPENFNLDDKIKFKRNTKNKFERIYNLEPVITQGLLKFKTLESLSDENRGYKELLRELRVFNRSGVSIGFDDCLDSLELIYSYVYRSVLEEKQYFYLELLDI